LLPILISGFFILLLVKEEISARARLPKQYHREKVEYMFNLDDETWEFIQPFKVHRPEAYEDDCTIMELSKGSDEDIVRLEDDYGREETPFAEFEIQKIYGLQALKRIASS
jgi:hypothetical protein